MVTDCCLDPFRFETTRCFFLHLQVLSLRCSWCFVMFHHVLLHHNLTTFLRPQPVLMRPMFGSFGKAVGRGLGQWEDARATSFFIEGTISICCICCISQSETLFVREDTFDARKFQMRSHDGCDKDLLAWASSPRMLRRPAALACAREHCEYLDISRHIYIDIFRSKGGSAFGKMPRFVFLFLALHVLWVPWSDYCFCPMRVQAFDWSFWPLARSHLSLSMVSRSRLRQWKELDQCRKRTGILIAPWEAKYGTVMHCAMAGCQMAKETLGRCISWIRCVACEILGVLTDYLGVLSCLRVCFGVVADELHSR